MLERIRLEAATRERHCKLTQFGDRIRELAESGIDMRLAQALHGELTNAMVKGELARVDKGLPSLQKLMDDVQAGFSRERANSGF